MWIGNDFFLVFYFILFERRTFFQLFDAHQFDGFNHDDRIVQMIKWIFFFSFFPPFSSFQYIYNIIHLNGIVRCVGLIVNNNFDHKFPSPAHYYVLRFRYRFSSFVFHSLWSRDISAAAAVLAILMELYVHHSMQYAIWNQIHLAARFCHCDSPMLLLL